jgi:hypothetical protein
VVIGANRYDISAIRSVNLTTTTLQPNVSRILVIVSFIGLLLGLLSCLVALSVQWIDVIEFFSSMPRINLQFMFAVFGLLLIVLWPVGLDAAKPTYTIQMETDAGMINILKSKDHVYSQRIREAIDKGIAYQQ